MRGFVVADDLTGANDTAAAFAKRGLASGLSLRTPRDETTLSAADVDVANTDSRYESPTEAASRVRRAVDSVDADLVYKKVDSTLRGNLPSEIDAVLDATGADVALVAPAFPNAGRITVGGYHLVDGTPVTETSAGRDPKGPASSHLPTVLEDADCPVVHRPLDTLGDAECLAAAFTELASTHRAVIVVCDASSERHLDTLARAGNATAADVVYVGSAGLAGHVRLGSAGNVLGVVGSVAPASLAQIEAMPSERVVSMDPERTVLDTAAAVECTVETVVDRVRSSEPVIVTAATEPADVDRALAAGREGEGTDQETRDTISRALGAVVRDVHRQVGLDGLLATGGAVATATLAALDAERVEITGQEVESGIPLARLEGGEADGLPCVTKAGSFGSEMVLREALRYLARYDGG